MSDPAERFIAAAVAPMAHNAELQLSARQELQDWLARESTPAVSLDDATTYLELPARRPLGPVLIYFLTLVVSVLAFALLAKDYLRENLAWKQCVGITTSAISFPEFRWPETSPLQIPALFGEFSEDTQMLLFGDLTVPESDRYLTPWLRQPDDPALFAEYFRSRRADPALLPTADRIDPGNGWYRYAAAGNVARNAVAEEENPRKSGRFFVIRRPAAFEEALELLEEAARQPRFTSYRDELLLQRLAVLPPGEDVLGRSVVAGFVKFYHPGVSAVSFCVFPAQAEILAAKGDAEGCRKLFKTWEILARRAPESLIPGNTPRAFFKAAAQLKLAEEEKHFIAVRKALARRHGAAVSEMELKTGTHGSRLANEMRWSSFPRPLDSVKEAALKPGRMAEHTLFARLVALHGWAFSGVAALLASVLIFRHGGQARLLSASLRRVLPERKLLEILGIAVLLPFTLYLLVEHSEILSGKQVNTNRSDEGILLRATMISGIMFALPATLVEKRFAELLGLKFNSKARQFQKFALIFAAVLWLLGIAAGWRGDKILPRELAVVPVLVGITLVVIGAAPLLAVIFSQRHEGLAPLVRCRALLPLYACSALFLAAASLLWLIEERHWIARDTLTKIDPRFPAASAAEHEFIAKSRAELLEILDHKP